MEVKETSRILNVKSHRHNLGSDHGGKTLCYKPEGRWFDSRLANWISQLT
jgi:hypothetical protein